MARSSRPGRTSCGSFLGYADGDAACDAVTTAQVLAFLAGKGPLTRHRENKYYALAGFWRYAISRGHATPLAAAGRRTEIARPGAALHLLARRVAAALRSRDRGDQPARCGSAGRSDIPDPASPVIRSRVALQRSDAPHAGGCRSGGSRSDHTRHEVLQEPSGSGRTAACSGAGRTTCPCAGATGLRKARRRSSWRTGTERGSPAAPFRRRSTRCGASPGSTARQAGDRSRACTIFGTASRFTA